MAIMFHTLLFHLDNEDDARFDAHFTGTSLWLDLISPDFTVCVNLTAAQLEALRAAIVAHQAQPAPEPRTPHISLGICDGCGQVTNTLVVNERHDEDEYLCWECRHPEASNQHAAEVAVAHDAQVALGVEVEK